MNRCEPLTPWLYRFGILKINVHVYVLADENLEKYIKKTPPKSLSDGRLTIGAIKVFYDGAMGSFGALLSEPYSDNPGNSGLQTTSDETLAEIAQLAKEKGYQLAALTRHIGYEVDRKSAGSRKSSNNLRLAFSYRIWINRARRVRCTGRTGKTLLGTICCRDPFLNSD